MEVKSWSKWTDAWGQIKNYAVLLRAMGKTVLTLRVHLFGVPETRAAYDARSERMRADGIDEVTCDRWG